MGAAHVMVERLVKAIKLEDSRIAMFADSIRSATDRGDFDYAANMVGERRDSTKRRDYLLGTLSELRDLIAIEG